MTANEIEFYKNWIRTVYSLKNDIDSWSESNLQDLWPGKFQLSYLQVLVYISEEITTNKMLAEKARISKQAMSKIVANMDKAGVIKLHQMNDDRRYSKISLTEKGTEIIKGLEERLAGFIKEYTSTITEKNLSKTLSIMSSLTFDNKRIK